MHNQFKTQKFKHLMIAMGPRDLNPAPYSPVQCSGHSMTSFQSSELTELPVVENSQLFAKRTVRPPCQSNIAHMPPHFLMNSFSLKYSSGEPYILPYVTPPHQHQPKPAHGIA